jgi:hypothetical protein
LREPCNGHSQMDKVQAYGGAPGREIVRVYDPFGAPNVSGTATLEPGLTDWLSHIGIRASGSFAYTTP